MFIFHKYSKRNSQIKLKLFYFKDKYKRTASK